MNKKRQVFADHQIHRTWIRNGGQQERGTFQSNPRVLISWVICGATKRRVSEAMKRQRATWALPLCISIFVLIADPQWIVSWSETSGTSRDSQDMLVPAFLNEDVENGLSGTVKYRVELNNGKVIHIEEISSDLNYKTDRRKYPELLDLPKRHLKGSIWGWRSMIVSPLSVEVEFEIVIDPTLEPNVRNYKVEIGGSGIPSRIVISGPLLQKKL